MHFLKLTFICQFLLLSACRADVETASEQASKSPKVLVIGWDGTRPDAVVKANTPNFDAVAARGAFTFKAKTQDKADTWSSPGWLSLLTGVQPDKHKVDSN